MPFPLQIGELEVPHAAGLGYVVAADLAAGGGTVVPDRSVEQWLPEVADQLDAEEQRALVRGLLLQRDANAIAAASAVALRAQTPDIGPYFLSALVHHDVGLLMTPDSWGRSVEEVLACAGADLCALEDDRWRGLVLTALRSCGAALHEAQVLVRYGTESELTEFVPSLLAGGSADVLEALASVSERFQSS